MCRVFEVSRSGYYEWLSRPVSHRDRQDTALKVVIRACHDSSRATYGTRRIQKALAKEDKAISRRRIARLMDEEGLKCIE